MKWVAAGRMALLATCVAVSVSTVTGCQESTARAGEQAAAASAEPPSASSFRSVRHYPQVAEPVRLRVPAAGVDTRLQQLGRAEDGSIEAPADFGMAGWFAEGPRPGEAGPAVLLGHLDSQTGPGVFLRLPRLTSGAEVVVDRADGSTVRFRVTKTLQVPKARFPTELVYGPTLEPSLRLVTCGGSFDRATGHYQDNVIAYADPAE